MTQTGSTGVFSVHVRGHPGAQSFPSSTKTVKLTPTALTDKLIQILRTYPLQQAEASAVTAAVPRPLDTAPDIILSESFDHDKK